MIPTYSNTITRHLYYVTFCYHSVLKMSQGSIFFKVNGPENYPESNIVPWLILVFRVLPDVAGWDQAEKPDVKTWDPEWEVSTDAPRLRSMPASGKHGAEDNKSRQKYHAASFHRPLYLCRISAFLIQGSSTSLERICTGWYQCSSRSSYISSLLQ